MQPSSGIPPPSVPGRVSPQLRNARLRMQSVARGAGAGVVLLGAAVALALNRPVARSALLLGLLSVGMAYMVAPIAGRLPLRRRPDRGPLGPAWRVLVVYAVLLVLGTAVWVAAAGPMRRQLGDLRAQIPFYTERARQRLEMIEKVADRLSPSEPLTNQVRAASRAVADAIRTQATRVFEEAMASRPMLRWLWLVPVGAFLLISRFTWFRDSAVAHLPEGHLRWRGEQFFLHLNSVLAGYTRAQLWSVLIVGAASAFGFRLIGVPYALLLGTMSGLLEGLPVVGPLTAAIAACTLVSGERLFVLLGFLVALRLAQDYVVYPRLASRGMHLHPLAIIVAIFAGAELGGMLGVLVAIPLVGIVSLTVRHWREYWAIERLVRAHAQKRASGGPAERPVGGTCGEVEAGDDATIDLAAEPPSGEEGSSGAGNEP